MNTIKKPLKILIALDDMIVVMPSNKKLNPIVTELFIRGRKLKVPLVFITQPYFTVPSSTQVLYENSKQKRASTIYIQILTLKIL